MVDFGCVVEADELFVIKRSPNEIPITSIKKTAKDEKQ
jgi:regulator of extracellular matrix RemA (YlzA/DUF370 family)